MRRLAFVFPILSGLAFGCEPPVVEEPPITLPPRVDQPGAADAGSDADNAAIGCEAPLSACGSTCVDLKKDDQQCGRCGRACGAGSSCTDGRCTPVTLAQNLQAPSALALGTSIAIILVTDGVVRCGKEGCAQGATRMWTETGWSTVKTALAMEPQGTFAYFLGKRPNVNQEKVFRVEPAAAPQSSPAEITTGVTFQLSTTFGLAADAREIFLGSPYRNYRCFKESCSAVQVAWDGETPTSVTISSTHYVWTMHNDPNDSVKICARPPAADTTYAQPNCGTPVGLAPPKPLGPIGFDVAFSTVHEGSVYWAEWGDSGKNGRILSCPLTGCNRTPKVIAAEEEIIDGLAVDATGAYWTSGAAGVVRVCRDLAKGCTTAETLAGGASNPGPIALDEKFAYYVARGGPGVDGALLKVAK